MNFLKRTLPFLIALIFGLLGITLNYMPHNFFDNLYNSLNKSLIIIYAFAAFLGAISLLTMHYFRIRRKTAGWGYSVIVFFGFSVTFGFAVFNHGNWFWSAHDESGGLEWLVNNVYVACDSTMFSILAFFIASAAYRAFRARTPEASILLIAAIIVMFGQVPISNWVSSSIPEFSLWLMKVPNLAVKRALLFGICLGMIATSLRIIFGIERSYLGGE